MITGLHIICIMFAVLTAISVILYTFNLREERNFYKKTAEELDNKICTHLEVMYVEGRKIGGSSDDTFVALFSMLIYESFDDFLKDYKEDGRYEITHSEVKCELNSYKRDIIYWEWK